FGPQITECPAREGPDAEDSPFSADPGATMDPASLQPRSDVSQPKDFTRFLPFQLSMSILGLLDQKSLDACSAVNAHWALLVREVQEEQECRSTVQKNLLQLQELCPRKTIPNYAKRVSVQIPQLNEEGDVIEVKEEQSRRRKSKTEDFNLHAAYQELKTHRIELEERNVFCGSYKTHVLMEQSDKRRIIHYNGGNLVAVASASRKVRLLPVPGGTEVPPQLLGHAGPVRALHLSQDTGLLLSSSFDLSVRCWNIRSGACVRTFAGHYGTVTCLHSHQERFVSGAGDGLVKVWSLKSGKCLKTLMHKGSVWAVRMDGSHVVSGGHRGLVKVWRADTGALIKTLERHQGPILCLSFDQWHLVTGSSDGYALGWSMLGNLRRCLMAFFHPKEVLSLEFLYLRVISGCADGHVRIFNFLTGTCLRVLVATSSGEPLSSLCVAENRLVINSPGKLVMFQFEAVPWDYSLPADREVLKKKSRRGRHQGSSSERRRAQDTQDTSTRSRQASKTRGTPKGNGPGPKAARAPGAFGQRSQGCTGWDCWGVYGEPRQGPAPPAADEAEATLQHELPRKDPNCPMAPDKFLLRISSLQSSCKPAPVSSGIGHSAKAREGWECPWEHQPGKVPTSKTPLQHKKDQAAQLQRARLHSDSLAMKTIPTPFETKMLRLRLQNSLHSPAVESSIPAPCLVRPRFCASLREKKTPSGHREDIPILKDGDQLVDLCTASAEVIQPTRGTTPRVEREVARGIKPFCPCAAAPSRRDSGFRLLTAEQEEREAALAAQRQAQQEKPVEGEERARRKAWLRKMRGLPVDSFTGERKTPAPELGHNAFI
ncbi:FBW10 protein, partial [Ptilonorhynchus violaceus]|nr:FBW10 protein [Ptilonorhynchus violaceus]